LLGGYKNAVMSLYMLLFKSRREISMTESYAPYTNIVTGRINDILKDGSRLEDHMLDMKIMKKRIESSINIYNCIRPHYSYCMLISE
jgi:hypothetical protein